MRRCCRWVIQRAPVGSRPGGKRSGAVSDWLTRPPCGFLCHRADATGGPVTPHATPTLERLDGSGKVLESRPIDRPELVIGREGDFALPGDSFLSRRHARIRLASDGAVILEDLESRNGVFVQVPGSVELRHGDHLLMGDQRFRFEIAPPTPSPPSAEIAPRTMELGSPAPAAGARLVRILQDGRDGTACAIGPRGFVVGRSSGNLVLAKDGSLSARHARICGAAGRYRVEDLKSRNGTFLRLRGPVTLQPGEIFRIGTQLLRVVRT